MGGSNEMNDIITDFIGKNISKRLENNRPIEQKPKVVLNDFEMNHLKNCSKQICPVCSRIALKGDNN